MRIGNKSSSNNSNNYNPVVAVILQGFRGGCHKALPRVHISIAPATCNIISRGSCRVVAAAVAVVFVAAAQKNLH